MRTYSMLLNRLYSMAMSANSPPTFRLLFNKNRRPHCSLYCSKRRPWNIRPLVHFLPVWSEYYLYNLFLLKITLRFFYCFYLVLLPQPHSITLPSFSWNISHYCCLRNLFLVCPCSLFKHFFFPFSAWHHSYFFIYITINTINFSQMWIICEINSIFIVFAIFISVLLYHIFSQCTILFSKLRRISDTWFK